MTDILIAPLRTDTALLAKQAATIDHLSGGRLVSGWRAGGREDDYEVGGVDFHRAGASSTRSWRSSRPVAGERGIGRRRRAASGPALLIGGRSDAAFRRAARYADGWTMGGGTPDVLARGARASWARRGRPAGRDGEPRTRR